MKRFVKKILTYIAVNLALLAILTGVDYFFVKEQYAEEYTAAVNDKLDRLLSIKEPKIILVGDSNLAFGVRSEMIEQAFSMPVVNLGLHGGLGNAFHENMLKLDGAVGEGDIVVVCHSFFNDTRRISDIELCWITVEWNKRSWQIIDKQDYVRMAMAYPRYAVKATYLAAKRKLSKEAENVSPEQVTTVYSRAAFNQYGDIDYWPEYPQRDFEEDSFPVPEIGDACTERLNELNQYVKSKGAKMVAAGFPIAYSEGNKPDAKEWDEFQKELEHALDFDVISDYKKYFIPEKYSYDFQVHMRKKGAEIRTEQLIEDLKNWGL